MRRAVLVVVLVALTVPMSSSAKNGEMARLLDLSPSRAKAGQTVSVRWTVDSRSASKALPFAAVGMFVRVVGAGGVMRTAVAKEYEPPYTARVVVPAGGIRKIVFGLQGWASTPTGTHYAPELFPTA